MNREFRNTITGQIAMATGGFRHGGKTGPYFVRGLVPDKPYWMTILPASYFESLFEPTGRDEAQAFREDKR